MGNIGSTDGKDIKNDTQDEIDKIMGEIENLQREMNSNDAETDKMVAEALAETPSESQVESAAEPGNEEVTDPAKAPDAMEEFHTGGDEIGIEETLGALEEEPAPGPTILDQVSEPAEAPVELPVVQKTDMAEVTPIRLVSETVSKGEPMSNRDDEKTTSEDGCLSMTLTGNMTLKLKYEYEGEEVHIGFSDHSLKVQLTDGTEFKIPVNRKAALKRVA